MEAQTGDLIFVWGDSFTDRVIRTLTGGPSHVRLCLGGDRVAEMVIGGFRYGVLEHPIGASGKPAGRRQELVSSRLDTEQQARCLQYVRAHEREKYSYIACVSQFLNLLRIPLEVNVEGELNCSQFAAAATGITDWCAMTPARLYQATRGGE